jgi:hypothetical protein
MAGPKPSSGAPERPFTIFLLSPANLGGKRAGLVLNPAAGFPLAEQLRSTAGAPLGQVFSFVSGLYFRGKMAYAEAFGRPPEGLTGGLVISAGEGLRFPHEAVTVERLHAWAAVSIDASNPQFTAPLVRHAEALHRAHGARAHFVLLGSVATDKYVEPLTGVFGDNLFFPSDFVGRGDMSRGALMLRAARDGRELAYEPVAGARRQGPRAPGVSQAARETLGEERRGQEVVILVGLPGAGKSTFFRARFAASHAHVSKDLMRNHRAPQRRQEELIAEALAAGRSLVVDNVNAAVEDRAPIIAAARRHGARVVGYFFECTTSECVARNAGREGKARIPRVGIFAQAKRLVRPSLDEGFDQLFAARPLVEQQFEVAALAR